MIKGISMVHLVYCFLNLLTCKVTRSTMYAYLGCLDVYIVQGVDYM